MNELERVHTNALDCKELEDEIAQKLEGIEQITLATSIEGKTYARTVCPVNDGLNIFFGTEGASDKAEQIRQNSNVALAVGNIQIEATAEIAGRPENNPDFAKRYLKKYPQFGSLYPATQSSIVVSIKPSKITLYKYLGKPCEDVLDVENKRAYRIDL